MANSNTPAILLLNIPAGALCGIDLLSFTTSPRFQGIKNLPPGWHFVFTGATTSHSVRHGIWFRIHPASSTSPADLIIKKWSPEKEELIPETSPTTLLQHHANLGAIWTESLTPYRQSAAFATTTSTESEPLVEEEKHDWHDLTDCISAALLTRITGESTPDNWTLTTASSAKQDEDHIPGLSMGSETLESEHELRFLPVNLKQTWREGAIGRERTEAAQDRSWALGDLVERFCQGRAQGQQDAEGDDGGEGDGEWEVVGELQVTFLMVLTLANYSCLEQWKRLLGLVLTCKAAVGEREAFYVKVVKLLRLQLQHCGDVDGGLFDLSDDGGALLKGLLKQFRRAVDEVYKEGESTVKDELEELEGFLRTQHGWELSDSYVRRGMLELEDGEQVEMEINDLEGEDERGEYAPIIVDTIEHGPTIDSNKNGS
ncbi:hypothetical protein MMC16_002154 [Acarospora aff. strigata]|nr:hypothetical protein [Acarospora aff. strigata]